MAFSVTSKWRWRMNSMAHTHSAKTAQSMSVCCTQKKGRWSSNKSRKVPPPKAAKNATTHTPTASSFLRAASIKPDKAKAAVADNSTSKRRVSPQD